MTAIKLSLLSYQAEFIEAQKTHLFPAFVGGTGSGKSYTLAIGAFLDALHSPDATIGVYGPTVAHVRDICMAYIISLLNKNGFIKGKTEFDGDYHVNKNEMKILSHHPQIGSFLFKSMNEPEDIIGYQTYTAHVDELDTMDAVKAQLAWQNIGARTRQWPGGLTEDLMQWDKDFDNLDGTFGRFEPRNKMCAYTTPEGFKFVYRTWAKSTDPDYCIVRGRTKDNHFNGSSYYKNQLKKFGNDPDSPRAKAYLEGHFVNLESGSVYYGFKRDSLNSLETIRNGEALFMGMDFNVGHMAARVFVKRYTKEVLEYHCVAELDDILDTPDIINIIKQRWPNHPITVYPDASGAARKTTNAGTSDLALLKQAGFTVRARAKNPKVKDRIACVNSAFMNRRIFVNVEQCPTTVECLEQQAYTKIGDPSKDTGHDHGNDAFGYFVSYEIPIKARLFAIPVRFIA